MRPRKQTTAKLSEKTKVTAVVGRGSTSHEHGQLTQMNSAGKKRERGTLEGKKEKSEKGGIGECSATSKTTAQVHRVEEVRASRTVNIFWEHSTLLRIGEQSSRTDQRNKKPSSLPG